jgi:putative chitinase
MRPIDVALLDGIGRRLDGRLAAALAPELARQLPGARIDTPLRIAHFLGQAAEETAGFTRLAEDLDYRHADVIARTFPRLAARAGALVRKPEALANAAYAGLWGNGDEASGDGWRYRGRGLFDHTFRDNYAELGTALGLPLVTQPDLLLAPANAVRAGIWFFTSRGCLALADRDDVEAITRRINGGVAGLAARRAYTNAALDALRA